MTQEDPTHQEHLRKRAQNDNQNADPNAAESEAEQLLKRFPTMPSSHEAPLPPKIKVDLPPHPDKPRPGTTQPGAYRSNALAYQAASSFFMPILVLALLGWWLDGHFHTHGLAIILCFILGFVVGVVSLLKVVNQMNDDPAKRS